MMRTQSAIPISAIDDPPGGFVSFLAKMGLDLDKNFL